MASTINGTSTGNGGIITTGDDSGVLNIQTNETTALTIDASQNVGIGVTPTTLTAAANSLQVYGGASQARIGLQNATTGSTATSGFHLCAIGSRAILDQRSASSLEFTTDATERMRIDSSGNLLVSKTADTDSVAGTVITLVDAGGAGKHGKIKVTNTVGTGQYVLQCLNASGSTVGGVTSSSTATAFPTSSDYRLKENIAPMTGALEKVASLKPVTYTWKANGEATHGFIAHELQEVVPECVTGEKDAVETYTDEEGNEQTRPVYQGIDTSFLVATLTAAIQEQQALITTLTERITALEAK